MKDPMHLEERFSQYFTPGDPDECWLWKGGRTGQRGCFRYGFGSSLAHRCSYEMYKGPIPKGLWVLHSCDNRLCVNPNHLRVGTGRDNARDRAEREPKKYGFFRNGHVERKNAWENLKRIDLIAQT